MSHQSNEKPPLTCVIEMLDGSVKPGLYMVAPELKDPRKYLKATLEAQEVALKLLYDDAGVRTATAQGSMECYITTTIWNKYFPHGQGCPTEKLIAWAKEQCPNPDQRWARYLERRLGEEGKHFDPQPHQCQPEKRMETSKPSSSKARIQNDKQATRAESAPFSSGSKISFSLLRKNQGSGESSSRGSKPNPFLDSDPKGKGKGKGMGKAVDNTPISTTTPPSSLPPPRRRRHHAPLPGLLLRRRRRPLPHHYATPPSTKTCSYRSALERSLSGVPQNGSTRTTQTSKPC